MRISTRIVSTVLTSALVCGIAGAANATEPTVGVKNADTTTVTLKNGASVRGEIVERIPGEKVVLKLATGEVRTIPWGDIAEPEESTSTESQKRKVEVQSDHEGTVLQRITGQASGAGYSGGRSVYVSFESWENVCAAPCKASVDANSAYRVDAPGMTPSRNFHLPPPGKGDPVKLRIAGGSAAVRGFGTYSLSFGIAGLITGAIFLPIGLALKSSGSSTSFSSSFPTIGIVSLAVGGVLTVLGVSLMVMSGTDVKTESGLELAKAKPAPKVRFTTQGLVF